MPDGQENQSAVEPRVTDGGLIGQVDATQVPRYGCEPTFARLNLVGADIVEVAPRL